MLLSAVFRGGNQDTERFRNLPEATQLGSKVDLKSGLAASQVQPLLLCPQLFLFSLFSFFSKTTKVAGLNLQPETRQRHAKDGEPSSLVPVLPSAHSEHSSCSFHFLFARTNTGEWWTHSRVFSVFTKWNSRLHRSLCSLFFFLWALWPACVAKETGPICSFYSLVTPQVTWPFPTWWDIQAVLHIFLLKMLPLCPMHCCSPP